MKIDMSVYPIEMVVVVKKSSGEARYMLSKEHSFTTWLDLRHLHPKDYQNAFFMSEDDAERKALSMKMNNQESWILDEGDIFTLVNRNRLDQILTDRMSRRV